MSKFYKDKLNTIENANFVASMDEIKEQQTTPVFDELPNEEKRDKLINALTDLEPFGLFNLNSLRSDKSYQLSTDIMAPPAPGVICEFGDKLNPESGITYMLSVVERLTYELLKIQVLKEGYVYRNHSFMIRIKRPQNRYPKYYHKKTINLWNGHDRAEIVFFAKSADGAKGIKDWIEETLCGQPLWNSVMTTLDVSADILSEKFFEDPDIQHIVKIQEYMELGFLKIHAENPFNGPVESEKGGDHE